MRKYFKILLLSIVSSGLIFTTTPLINAQEIEENELEKIETQETIETTELEAQKTEETEPEAIESIKIENHIAKNKAVISFPDQKVERAVRKYLGLDVETPITENALQILTTLKLEEPGTYDLTGLEHATSLREFSVNVSAADNSDQSIDLPDLSPLFELPITELSFVNKINFKGSDIEHFADKLVKLRLENYVETMSLSFISHLTNLQKLFIQGGQTPTAIDASIFTELTNVNDLSFHQIKFNGTLNLQGLTNIDRLALMQTDIVNLDFIDSSAPISYISCLNNDNLKDASHLASITTITYLSIAGSKLENIDFISSLSQLNTVYLGRNNISDLSVFKNTSAAISTLNLSDNNISDISFFEDFEIVAPFIRITLDGNHIADFTPLAKFEGNPNITIEAVFQTVDLGQVQIDVSTPLNIKPHIETEELYVYSPADFGTTEPHGTFTYADGMITFHELTPTDDPLYNYINVLNFDIFSRASTNIQYHIALNATVVEAIEPIDPIIPIEPENPITPEIPVTPETPTTSVQPGVPNTGDANHLTSYVVLLIVSSAMIILGIKKRNTTTNL